MTSRERALENFRRVNRILGQLESLGAELTAQADLDYAELLKPEPAVHEFEPATRQVNDAEREEHKKERAEWVRYTALLNRELQHLSGLLIENGISHALLNPIKLQDCVMELGLAQEELEIALQSLNGQN